MTGSCLSFPAWAAGPSLRGGQLYLILPVFSMWRMMKYAEKHSAAMVSEIMSWNNISTSRDPSPYYIGAVEDGKGSGYQDKHLENLGYPVFRHRHPVAYIRKRPVDGPKLLRYLIHALNGNGEGCASQAESCGGLGGGFLGRLAFMLRSFSVMDGSITPSSASMSNPGIPALRFLSNSSKKADSCFNIQFVRMYSIMLLLVRKSLAASRSIISRSSSGSLKLICTEVSTNKISETLGKDLTLISHWDIMGYIGM